MVAGNLARQPGVAMFSEISFDALERGDFIHKQGFYLGIHPIADKKNLTKVTQLLNSFCGQW